MENLFQFLWILFLSAQLGKHFWPGFSLVNGIRVDYLAPVIYLQDIFFVGWFVFGGYRQLRKIKKYYLWIGLILLNVIVATVWQVSLFRAIRWLMLFLLVLKWKENKKDLKRMVLACIPFWVAVEYFLSLGQFVTGSSMGGIWYWLGERSFSYLSIGVAVWSLFSDTFIRVYGTFSHPNSLGGFMLVVWFLWLIFKPKVAGLWEKTSWWIVSFMALGVIFLTGSRLVWSVWFLGIMIRAFYKIKNKGWWWILLGIFMGAGSVLLPAVSGWDESSFLKRISLATRALEIIRNNLLFGVGLGNFVANLPNNHKEVAYFWLQPVHNVGLLLVAELGLPVFLWGGYELWGWFLRHKRERWAWGLLGLIVLTGMWDHYWLTLPQNLGLLAIVLGLVW